MKKYWILVAMLGTCLLWSAKTWGNEQVRRTVSHPAGWSGLPDYAGGYTGYGGYGGGTGDKTIGGRIMTTPNSKMTNDWLDFDNQLDRDSLTQLEKVVKIRKIEQRNREIAEQEMAEDLAHRQAQISYELAEQKRKEGIRQRYAEVHAKQAELPIPAKGTITGIAYSENSASALLNSEIIHEGDTIYGATVVKINKDNVEFEKNSNRWTQRIKETPAPYWE